MEDSFGTEIVHIRKKFQVTIPKKIRKHLGLQPGDFVLFWVGADDKVIMDKGIIQARAKINEE